MATNETGLDTGAERPLQDRVSFRLARVQAKLNAQATRILKENGDLTLVQWRVLVMLQAIGQSTVGEIARETQFDKALISRTVQALVTRGLVTLHENANDHRQHLLNISAKGQSVFKSAAPHMFARQQALTNSMSDEQRHHLFDALDRLERAAETT